MTFQIGEVDPRRPGEGSEGHCSETALELL